MKKEAAFMSQGLGSKRRGLWDRYRNIYANGVMKCLEVVEAGIRN